MVSVGRVGNRRGGHIGLYWRGKGQKGHRGRLKKTTRNLWMVKKTDITRNHPSVIVLSDASSLSFGYSRPRTTKVLRERNGTEYGGGAPQTRL